MHWNNDSVTTWTDLATGKMTTSRPATVAPSTADNLKHVKAAIISYKDLTGSSMKDIKTFIKHRRPTFTNSMLCSALKMGQQTNQLVRSGGRFKLAPRAPPTSKGKSPGARRGGGALPFIQGGKRKMAADVMAKRPAPTFAQTTMKNGNVRYRTNAVEVNSIGDRECVVEALRFALGTNRLTRAYLKQPRTGDVRLKDTFEALQKKTPFRFTRVAPGPWSYLLTLEPGIYIGRAVMKNSNEQHYICLDRWRNLFFIGGPPEPAPVGDKVVEADRYFFIEPDELANPQLFQEFMKKTFAVHGDVQCMYRIDVVLSRAHETAYS